MKKKEKKEESQYNGRTTHSTRSSSERERERKHTIEKNDKMRNK